MKALVSPKELVYQYTGEVGWRVAQVEQDENIFDVADPLFWDNCADDCIADAWYYCIEEKICKPNLVPDPALQTPVETLP